MITAQRSFPVVNNVALDTDYKVKLHQYNKGTKGFSLTKNIVFEYIPDGVKMYYPDGVIRFIGNNWYD